MKRSQFKHYDTSSYNLPKLGFKIHISGTIENYRTIYESVIPYLIFRDVAFKYIEAKESIVYNLSEEESSAESGKLITIYPKNNKHCKQLLEELYKLIPSECKGVYILSDRNYRDSNVIFYRFGCIKLIENELVDGLPSLKGTCGEYWQDFQRNYFDLPSWVDDLQEKQEFKPSYLGDTYQVLELLKNGNGGNVYKAKQKDSGKLVVIIECRPHVICTTSTMKNDVRENEWFLSKNIQSFVPQRIEKVSEWINQYYIYEYINGQNLADFCSNGNLFSLSSYSPEKNFSNFANFINCIRELLLTVQELHKLGLVLNDIHPNNFVIDKNLNVHFIDLENSYFQNDKPLTGVYSEISLKQWNHLEGKVADCHKIGNMLLYLIGKLNLKEGDTFVKKTRKLLLQKNIDTNLDILIDYLLTNDADIDVAVHIFDSQIYFKKDITRAFALDFKDIHSETPELDITDFVLSQNQLIKSGQETLKDKHVILDRIKKEKFLGLNGSMGILVYLKSCQYDSGVIESGVQFVLDNLVTIDEKLKGVPISENAASPYLYNGTAGIIQALIYIDSEKYLEDIYQLSETLLIEYAQSARYLDGMLGISQTLLKIFELTKRNKYLRIAKELLIVCGILAEKDQSLQTEYLYILNQFKMRYLGEKNEIIV